MELVYKNKRKGGRGGGGGGGWRGRCRRTNLGGQHSRCGLQRRAGSAQVSGGTDEAATGGAKVKVSARETEALTAFCDATGTGTLNSAHPSGTAHLLTRLTGQL